MGCIGIYGGNKGLPRLSTVRITKGSYRIVWYLSFSNSSGLIKAGFRF